ncbi:hypothetical protein MATL_G00113350 [Megalops atlanticus]|uniref:Uncharacterized protein n=1 Tax=Megalops atlanticus TaxID=7932 RepID=A0A9D3T6X6_MEGAT|nr:hypothetical protein MATL_G00113350 [Megalops atlanticus]
MLQFSTDTVSRIHSNAHATDFLRRRPGGCELRRGDSAAEHLQEAPECRAGPAVTGCPGVGAESGVRQAGREPSQQLHTAPHFATDQADMQAEPIRCRWIQRPSGSRTNLQLSLLLC